MRRRTHFHSADGHRVSNRKRRWLTWVFAVIFGSAPGTARDIPFATPVTAASSNGVLQAVATDVDGDGTLDVVTVSSVDAVVAWHDNTSGDGSAWSSTTIATSADAAVAMADFDGDGDVDALVGSTVSDAFFLRFNTAGDGSAWSGSTITDLASGDPTDIKPADIDGDGDIDVLITLEETDEVIFFENVNGDGTSWTRLTITDTATDAIAVAAGDIDGDGDIDALVASPGDNTVAFHENTAGDGSAWSEVTISSTFGGARDVFAADVDGDGDLDAVAVARVDDEVSWFENTAGDGSLWTERNIATSILAAFGVFAADLDGDGDVDVLSANRQSDSVLWFENTMGEGTGFTQRTVAAIETASAVVAGDVDGDGDVDVFAASYTDDEVTWHANDTIHRDAFFPTEQTLSSTTAYASSVATADIDGDGDIDAFSAAYNGNAFSWHENTAADGSAWTTQTVASGLIGPLSVVAADIDGDGDQDGVAASFYSEVWFRNDDGMGGSWSTLTIADGGDFERRVAAGDLDGDGDQDVVSASLTNNTVTFHENTAADGSTWAPLLITGTATSVRDVKIADIDGDGDQDVLSASFDDNSVDWYENTAGDGSAWTTRSIASGVTGAYSVCTADFDGDGDLDVMSAAYSDGAIQWSQNTLGDGSSWNTLTAATNLGEVNSVFCTDLDGDGDVDVLYSTYVSGTLGWIENVVDGLTEGEPTWIARAELPTTVDGFFQTVAADVDGDGDQDALAASFPSDTIAWYENRGGQFALPTTDVAPARAVAEGEDAVLAIDLAHRGQAGDSDIELTTIELLFTDGAASPLTSAEANAVIENLVFYLDDGDGIFDAAFDTEVATITDLSLSSGIDRFTFSDGDANVTSAFGADKSYFVVAEWTPGADTATPDQIDITHITSASSTAEDATADIPLILEGANDVTSTLVEINDAPVANGDGPFLVSEDTTFQLGMDPSVLDNDMDEESDTLEAILDTDPTNADSFSLESDGTFTYTPLANFSGTDSFTYIASDGFENSNLAAVDLTITPVADAPDLVVNNTFGLIDTAIGLDITASLVDTDGSETLEIEISGVPTGATLSAGVDQGGGVWLLQPGDLTGLTITPPVGDDSDIKLTVTAIATETANDDQATSVDTILVDVRPILVFEDGFESGDTSAWSSTVDNE